MARPATRTSSSLNPIPRARACRVDVADSQPCIGTGGIFTWSLTATGKMFHSGLPHKSVNPLELAMEALAELQRRFYQDFPPHPLEDK